MLILELEKLLSPTEIDLLKTKTATERISVEDLVKEYLQEYVNSDEDEDTPDEFIMESLRQAFLEIKQGKAIPAKEALAKLRQELEDEQG